MLSWTRKALCLLMIGMMLSTPLLGARTLFSGSDDTGGALALPPAGPLPDADDALLPADTDAAATLPRGAKGTMKVYVATTDVPELANYLASYDYRGALGSQGGSRGISFLLLDLPLEAIPGVSQLAGVLGVYEYLEPQYSNPVKGMEEWLGTGKDMAEMMSSVGAQASAGGISGFTGQGVQVGVVDTGVDFAHPDLWGAYARDMGIYEVKGEVVVASTAAGQDEMMLGSMVAEVVDDVMISSARGGEQKVQMRFLNMVDGTDVLKINDNETTNYTIDPATGFVTLNTPLDKGDSLKMSYSYYFVYRDIVPGTLVLYDNDTVIPSSEYTYDQATGQVTFSTPRQENRVITADYQYYSPYYGWPIAFDPVSMDRYISSQGDPSNTFYVNTNISGAGPFESSHTITLDGLSDFSENEAFTGVKITDDTFTQNFDLEKLYATRDYDNWYFGFSTRQGVTDKTYTIYIDADGSASGGTYDPLGNYVDTNSSHSQSVNVLAYNPTGSLLASAAGNVVKLWDTSTGENIATIKPGGSYVGSLDWSQNGTWVCIANEKEISVWDVSTPTDPVRFNKIQYVPTGTSGIQEDQVLSISENVTGTWLALAGVANVDTRLFIYDATNTSDAYWARYSFPTIGKHINALAYSPNGSMVALAFESNDNTKNLRVIMPVDNTTYLELATLSGHDFPVTTVAWSPDSTKLISGDSSGKVKVWDVPTATCLNTFNTGTGAVRSVAWGQGGRIAAAGDDAFISIWDDTTYGQVANITGLTAGINTVDFSSAGPLASGSDDTKVSVWTSGGLYTRTFLSNLPDYAIVVNYTRERSDDWFVDEEGIVLSHNDTMANATLYTWTGSAWSPVDIMEEGGSQSYRSFADATNEKVGKGFMEIAVPRSLFAGDPDILDMEMFVTGKFGRVDMEWVLNATGGETTAALDHGGLYPNQDYAGFTAYEISKNGAPLTEGTHYTIDLGTGQITFTSPLTLGDVITATYYYNKTASRPQDAVPTDANVPYPNTDWSDNIVSLSNFGRREISYYSVDLPADQDSESGVYKFGFHPGEAQVKKYGTLGVLVVDNGTAGLYERVYIDLNNDKVFDDKDAVVYKGRETSYIDSQISGVGPGTDGIPDYSAGTLYYISDGIRPIPYSEVFSEHHGVLDRKSEQNWTGWRNVYVPRPGELVCLEGEFGYDEDQGGVLTHGTMSAAVIAGRGNTTLPNPITGMAPNATIIPVYNINQEGNIFDAWYFTVEGYDGVPGTGDEAVVVNNGFNYPKLYEDGWDPYSRYADYISMEYAGGKTLLVTSAGDEGFGYGTLSSPGAGPGVLAVGAATDYYYKSTSAFSNREGDYPHSGDVAFSSSRGPSALGIPKPDVIAPSVGVTATVMEYDGGSSVKWYNEPWIGSDYACAYTVGVLALVSEAYYNTNHQVTGEVLEADTENPGIMYLAHSPVVGGTLTLYDNGTPVSTGDYTVDLSTGMITFSQPVPEDHVITASYTFTSEHPDAMTARTLLMSGASDARNDVLAQGAGLVDPARSIDLARNADGMTVSPASWVPGDFNGNEYEAYVKLMSPGETATAEFTVANTGMASSTVAVSDGLYKKIGQYEYGFTVEVKSSTTTDDFVNMADILDHVPPGTELLQITAHAPFSDLDADGDDVIDEDSGADFIYQMRVVDWNDTDDSGDMDRNDYDEQNTFDICDLASNVLQVQVNSPVPRSHDGLWVIMEPKDDMPAVKAGETKYITWTLTCSFYARSDWDWLSEDTGALTVSTGGTATFSATMDIPQDAGIGTYDGAIYLKGDVTQVSGEAVVEYPTYHADEGLVNVSMYSVTDELVTNSTQTDAQLANFPVTGSPQLWINGSTITQVVNETSYTTTAGDVGNDVTFYTANAPLLDISMYVFIPGDAIYPLEAGADYMVNMTTGEITTTFGGVDEGWEFYTYYNYSLVTVTQLTEGVDYTLDYGTGAVTLTSPLNPGDQLYANYTWYVPAPATVTLSNTPVHTLTLYLNGTGVFTDYTVDLATGVITFTQSPGPGDIINASYEWYVPMEITGAYLDNQDIVPGSLTVYDGGTPIGTYTLDANFGFIMFDTPLAPGSSITADYSYYAQTITIPVMVNIAADRADFSFGGETIFDVTGDMLTDVPTVQVVNETIASVTSTAHVGEFVANVPTTYVGYEFVVDNPLVTVTGEYLDVMGGETEAYLQHGPAPGEKIRDCTLYANGTPMTEGVDYTIIKDSGIIVFAGAYSPLPPGTKIVADYTYYNPGIHYAFMDLPAGNSIVPGSYVVYLNWTPLVEGVDYSLNLDTGTITFLGSIYNLPLFANITCEYSYYPQVTSAQLVYGGAPDEAIVPGSYMILDNGVPLAEGVDYDLDLSTGTVSFAGTYNPLPLGSVITANYSHYNILDTAVLSHGPLDSETIVGASYVLTRHTANTSAVLTEGTDYVLDPYTGTVTFMVLLEPGDSVTADYSYFDPADYARAYGSDTDTLYSFTTFRVNYGMDLVNGTLTLYKNSAPLAENVDYMVDLATGIITLTAPLAPGDTLTADYTYSDATAYLFSTNNMLGGYGAGGQSGDWRFFYLSVPNQGLNKNPDGLLNLFVDARWNAVGSDIDAFVFTSTAQTNDPASGEAMPEERYGPGTLTNSGGSEESDTLLTSTGSNEEVVTATLTGGLNVVALHAVRMNGTAVAHEEITGEVGWVRLSTDNLEVRTNDLAGETSFTLVSNKEFPEGMNASAVGPASGETSVVEVSQDNLDIVDELGFYQALTIGAGFHKPIKVESALTLYVHCWPDDPTKVPDVDLGICYDANNDGYGQFEELVTADICEFVSHNGYGYQPFYASCADWDADEAVTLINPPDGQYVITILGYDVKQSPQPLNLEIKAIRAGVEGFGMSGTVGEDINDQGGTYETADPVEPFTVHTYSMSWNFPGTSQDGDYGGVISLGPARAPGVLSMLASVILDTESPVLKEPTPADGSVISDARPTINAMIEDLSREEIDASSVRVAIDGVDVTALAKINVALDEESAKSGYPRGMVIYEPDAPLSEGGHVVEVTAADWTGNEVSMSWGFTVDTTRPALSLDIPDDLYVSDSLLTVSGSTDPGAAVALQGVIASISQREDGSFSSAITLSDGLNQVKFTATDMAGNTNTLTRNIYLDTTAPEFNRLIALDGATTNKRVTAIYGELTEPGTLMVGGRQVQVNSDGTFRDDNVELVEGQNTLHLVFTDMAGNAAHRFMNITLDTSPPVLDIGDIPRTVSDEWLNITGTASTDTSTVTVNGKLVVLDGSGGFSTALRLSPGSNTLVIEGKDRAGNTVTETINVSFLQPAGTNWAAIGLMIALLVIGLVLGLLFGGMLGGGRPAEEELAEEPEEEIQEEPTEELPEGEYPEEEALEYPAEELPEDKHLEEELPGDEYPEEEAGEPAPGAEPIPLEEAIPEEEPPEAEPIPQEEAIPEELPAEEPEPEPVEEDPRIVKLREAYESGKISKELYEKNLARFKGEK